MRQKGVRVSGGENGPENVGGVRLNAAGNERDQGAGEKKRKLKERSADPSLGEPIHSKTTTDLLGTNEKGGSMRGTL